MMISSEYLIYIYVTIELSYISTIYIMFLLLECFMFMQFGVAPV